MGGGCVESALRLEHDEVVTKYVARWGLVVIGECVRECLCVRHTASLCPDGINGKYTVWLISRKTHTRWARWQYRTKYYNKYISSHDDGLTAVMRLNLIRPCRNPCAISGITSAPCVCRQHTLSSPCHHPPTQHLNVHHPSPRTLIVVHPACIKPLRPCGVSADCITAPQKGATSLLQSAIFTSVKPSASISAL